MALLENEPRSVTVMKWLLLAALWVFLFLVWHAHAIFEEDD
jgi:hypothetical protein